jgi:hypothetical protein
MQTNQWFKLALLAFAGIIISSVSLSLLTPAGLQSNQGPAAHTQGVSHGGAPANNSQLHNTGVNGAAAGNYQMNQNQLMEMQYRLWEMERRLNSMIMGGYGMYGPTPGMNPNMSNQGSMNMPSGSNNSNSSSNSNSGGGMGGMSMM